jgi:chromosome segregation ATPase
MNNDDTTAKPTIETVLERVNELGEQLTGQLTELRNGQAELRSEVAELRAGQIELRSDVATMKGDLADLKAGQRKIEIKIEILNNTILTVHTDLRADLRDFDSRLEKLESQPS